MPDQGGNVSDVGWEVIKAVAPAVPGLLNMLRDALSAGHGDADTREKVAELVREKLPEKSETERALEDLDQVDSTPTPIEVPHPQHR